VGVGSNVTFSVTAEGTGPLGYQWSSNGVSLTDGGQITGSQSNVLTLTGVNLGDAATYGVIVTNIYGSASASATLNITSTLQFDGGANWSAQGSSFSWPSGNVLQLTKDVGGESNSAFGNVPLYIGAFQASFTYQCLTGPVNSANGVTFCIQNDPRGAAALGAGAGSLGVSGVNDTPGPGGLAIYPSVEFEFNIYTSNGCGGVGVSFDTNGAIDDVASTAPLVINSGHPIHTVFTYENGVATVTLTDTTTSAVYSASTNINIPGVIGANWAYVGFTGADRSGSESTQQISDFSFVSLPNGAQPSIATGPLPAADSIFAGQSAAFAVDAVGTLPLYYQWATNGAPVAGATNSSFTATNVPAGAWLVTCLVTNQAGSAGADSSATLIASTPMAYQSQVMALSPVNYWPLNEPAGSATAYDYAGGANGAYGSDIQSRSLNGQPGVPNPPFLGFANDLGVSMYNQDSTPGNGYVTTPPLGLNGNTATLLCWIYPYGTQDNPVGLVFCRSGSTVAGSQIGGGMNLGYTWNNLSSTYGWASGVAVPANAWSLVALVATPSNAVVSLFNANGTAGSVTNAVTNAVQSFAGGIAIGADPQTSTLPQRIFNGEMDDVALFNYALSPSQMEQIYLGGVNPPTTVTAASTSRVYGAANPVFTGTITGLSNGANITATYSTTATTSSPVGTYPIVPALVDPSNLATNYTVSLINGTLTVIQAAPVVTWNTPAPIIYGTALSSIQLNASSNVPGTFSYNAPIGAVWDAGTYTLSALFTPSDTIDYTSITDFVSVVVSNLSLPVWQATQFATFSQATNLAALLSIPTNMLGMGNGMISFIDPTNYLLVPTIAMTDANDPVVSNLIANT
jgi:hypothetical protein